MSPFFSLSKHLVLASNSPRRKELLGGLGYRFEVRVVDVDESFPERLPAEEVAAYVASAKAETYSVSEHEAILCADTVVVADKKILGKPVSRDEAIRMLGALSGGRHQVISAVVLKTSDSVKVLSDHVTVSFKKLDVREIEFYVDHFRPFDKAGGYGIQEWIGMMGVERIDGSFYTVMGLPTHLVYELLKPFHLTV